MSKPHSKKAKKNRNYVTEKREKKDLSLPKFSRRKKVWAVVFCVLFCLYAFLSVALVAASDWITKTYEKLDFEQILFNMKMPLTGVDPTLISSAVMTIGEPAFLALLIAAILYIPLTVISGFGILITKTKAVTDAETGEETTVAEPVRVIRDTWYLRLGRCACWFIATGILCHALITADNNFKIFDYLESQFNASTFIEDNYADPAKTTLTFPEKKRNLIYIFLESTETTFTSKENGGAFDEDVIAELAAMMRDEENTHFSNTDKLGGAVSQVGATWTMGGMFAQSSGLPLKLPLDYNNMLSKSDTFLSYTDCLGDILQDNGYNQAVLMGSNGTFGGRTNYYTIHGEQTIYDWNTADDDGIRGNGYYKNYWGLFDKDLYAYAKQILGEMSASDEPFAFTMLTVDTHFSNGYPCDYCSNFTVDADGNRKVSSFKFFNKQYSNVYSCASRQIAAFVDWLKEQDFYENTTIVIAGDHETMDANYCKNVPESYVRTPVNLFINSAVDTTHVKNRQFSTMDMFPTTLAAMGVKIEGNKLGLGTDLFSGDKTLIEEYGLEYFESEIAKKSAFYNKMLFAQ